VNEDRGVPDAKSLSEQIQALPPERIAQVEDFVALIAAGEQDRSVVRAAAAASAPAFGTLWDNAGDDAYDAV
jgi:hypothetical protein